MILPITITVIVCSFVAVWDIFRRHINDQRAAREFRAEHATRLLQELQQTSKDLTTLTEYLKNRQDVSEKALVNFIEQARDLVKYSEERRLEMVKKTTKQAFESQR
jgi:K+ transporter